MTTGDFERQVSHDLQVRVKESQDRFDQRFATLCFAALALSLQFSERPNSVWKPALVAAWGFYLLAALLSGWRMMHSPQFDKIAWARIRLEEFIRQRRGHLQEPAFLDALAAGEAMDPNTGKTLTLKDAREGLAEAQVDLGKATRNLDALQAKFRVRFKVSLWSLMVALFFNGLYLALNFLRRG